MNTVYRKFRWVVSVLLLTSVVGLSGCATLGEFNAATGRKEFILIPTDAEVTMGSNIHQEIIAQYGLTTQKAQLERVQSIGRRLAKVSDRQDYQYNFFLVKGKDINAFTTPGGNIYFFEGLLSKLTNDDQVAAVLAHEIGHCAARHTIKKYQAQLGYNLLGSIIFSQIGMSEGAKAATQLASNAAMQLAMSAYSRKDEYESDRLGVKYMYLAGYRLDGMIETLQVLERESKGAKPPLILSTHPYVTDRIKAAQEEIKGAPLKYQSMTKKN